MFHNFARLRKSLKSKEKKTNFIKMENDEKDSKSSAKSDSHSSPGSSPRKCNLSFTFNFDVECGASVDSSDSENADLQIDVSQVDDYVPPKKRPRIEVEESSAIGEMEEEIERQLDAKAAKTNLTATNVKNILRHVITNEHVMAMVQNRLHNIEDGIVFEPKLTRAKAKELAMKQPNIPWPMTPVKKTSSLEVQELIEKDLSEDSSDEEYNPEQSDEEGEQVASSDVDSQPSTPASREAALKTPEKQIPADVHFDNEGIFKVPGIPHVPTEEESIGQRTRSKLCLSETPLEQIEQAFIPPDITFDMYDWDCGTDPDWDNFLKEFTQPLGLDGANEDDPEADPEYNILEDKETDLLDKEELRMDKAVKVTKKELNDLVAELFEFEDMFSKDSMEAPKKRNSQDNCMISCPNNSSDHCMVDLLPALSEPELPKLISTGQKNLLATQLRQHVQLMAQHFGMTYMHPDFHNYSKKCKENLNSLSYLQDGPDSAFNVGNLPDALKFVSDLEMKFQNKTFADEFSDFMAEEKALDMHYSSRGHKYVPLFHPEIADLFVECKAFLYPQLLPHMPFRSYLNNSTRGPYLQSEDFLIALGLEQFTPFVHEIPKNFNSSKYRLMDVSQLISQYLVPSREAPALYRHIMTLRGSKTPNPIKTYFDTGSAPKTIHCITLDFELVAPKDQQRKFLPRIWQDYLERNVETRKKLLHEKMMRLSNINVNYKKTYMKFGKYPLDIIVDDNLRNPIVNMLPVVQNLPAGSAETNAKETGSEENSETRPKDGSPQLRKTTPRLAKIRSAQNMKLMAQVSGSRSPSSCSRMKSKAKSESSKDSEESCDSSKGDNEDEIAELMLACTTIKKDTANRKKAKQARELENIKRLLEAESESAQEERMAKFAASYLQKLHTTLEPANPETLRAVMKTYGEYTEKLDAINETILIGADHPENRAESAATKNETARNEKNLLAINLYKDICNHLQDYPELRTDFLLFLTPHQAALIDESTQHTMLRKMSEFMHVAQIYFAKQPSRLTRVMKAITQLASDRYVTMADVHAAIDPILRGHPLVMDLFLQILPMGKPPDSLFAMNLFENLTCPMGIYDKHKVYTEDSPELYENMELPSIQDDPYGGENCKCDCHDSSSPETGVKTITEHCVSCGTRFLNGKIFLQTSEGLRPAKITFPGNEEEKLDNIARISLKTNDRCVSGSAGTSTATRRRKFSKNDTEDTGQKNINAKTSPNKEASDDGEKSASKSRRGAKSPTTKIEQRKLSKVNDASLIPGTSSGGSSSGEPLSPLKSKRETRAERREAKLELKNTSQGNENMANEEISGGNCQQLSNESQQGRTMETNLESFECSSDSDLDKTDANRSIETGPDSMDSGNSKPWTRHEDTILLQNIQKNYSETTFATVSAMLGDRTVEEVADRCQTLLALLERMA